MNKLYGIAERFTSPQGEGRHAGTLMQFIRFAGCTVGKPFSEAERNSQGLAIFQEKCTTYDDRTFACDTDYRIKERLNAIDLVGALDPRIRHVLLTGGEPLAQNLDELMQLLKKNNYTVHVETSGTVRPDLNTKWWHLFDWICVSPKKGFLDQYADLGIANEFKLLVDAEFDWELIPQSIRRKEQKISLSPINDLDKINYANVARCLEIQQQHPNVKLTLQTQNFGSKVTMLGAEEALNNQAIELYTKHDVQFVPTFPWVFVRLMPREQRLSSGLWVPDNAKDKQHKPMQEGIVLITWEPCDGKQSDYKPGDHVTFQHWVGMPMPGWDERYYRVVPEMIRPDRGIDWNGIICGKINYATSIEADLIAALNTEFGISEDDAKLRMRNILEQFDVIRKPKQGKMLSGVSAG